MFLGHQLLKTYFRMLSDLEKISKRSTELSHIWLPVSFILALWTVHLHGSWVTLVQYYWVKFHSIQNLLLFTLISFLFIVDPTQGIASHLVVIFCGILLATRILEQTIEF